MRTNIVIDDALMAKVMEASGHTTKKQAVEEGLRLLLQRSQQRQIRTLRGKVRWDGDLDAMREAK